MKYFIVLSSCILAVLARPQSNSQYGVPSNISPSSPSRGLFSSSSGRSISNTVIRQQQSYNSPVSNSISNTGGGYDNSAGSNAGNSLGGSASSLPDGPKVYKHISIHVPPMDEFEEPTRRVIRPMMASDKHINIIFVKAPSMSSNQQTEVILPEEAQQKTIVYILVKKRNQSQNDVKIRQPQPTRPPKPEVYFIKYGRDQAGASAASSSAGQGGQSVGQGGQSVGQVVASGQSAATRPEYGVPSNL